MRLFVSSLFVFCLVKSFANDSWFIKSFVDDLFEFGIKWLTTESCLIKTIREWFRYIECLMTVEIVYEWFLLEPHQIESIKSFERTTFIFDRNDSFECRNCWLNKINLICQRKLFTNDHDSFVHERLPSDQIVQKSKNKSYSIKLSARGFISVWSNRSLMIYLHSIRQITTESRSNRSRPTHAMMPDEIAHGWFLLEPYQIDYK